MPTSERLAPRTRLAVRDTDYIVEVCCQIATRTNRLLMSSNSKGIFTFASYHSLDLPNLSHNH